MRTITATLLALTGAVLGFATANAEPLATVLYAFTGGSDGAAPQGVLVADGAGNLYGTASAGGSAKCAGGCGVVFKLTPPVKPKGSWTETVLYAFKGGTDGQTPLSGLIFDETGALYGTTVQGGGSSKCTDGCGTVFKLRPPATNGKPWTETVLHRFIDGVDGASPLGGVVADATGALYGTTGQYPAPPTSTCLGSPCGTVYKLAPPAAGNGAWKLTVLHKFSGGTDGNLPLGTLFAGEGGALFGVTGLGGSTACVSFGCGTVFMMTPPTGNKKLWTEAVIHVFTGGTGLGGSDLGYPSSDLIADADGALYGTAYIGPGLKCMKFGCGGVFKLAPPATKGGGWTESVLYAFKGGPDGASPTTGRLAFGSAGALYGTTPIGGADADGTVFRMVQSSRTDLWFERVFHTFQGGADGSTPQGGLVTISGRVYGTTTKGGLSGFGTVFQLGFGPRPVGD